jgi:hypothetical protein
MNINKQTRLTENKNLGSHAAARGDDIQKKSSSHLDEAGESW